MTKNLYEYLESCASLCDNGSTFAEFVLTDIEHGGHLFGYDLTAADIAQLIEMASHATLKLWYERNIN
jgi:hypothetical protein